MEIKILYEDDNVVVIDKPSGLIVHGDGKTSEKTVCDWFVRKYPESKNVGEPQGDILRPGIVHRLDKETSGVLILCKNQESHEFIKKQFQNHEIKKTYLALVYGELKKEEGVIDQPIGRSPSDFRRRLAGRGARGEMRDAKTEFKKIKTIEIEGEKYTLVEVYPKTGRTHQIRVHMKYLSYPIVCDKLYMPKNLCPQIFGRLMLHAKSIEFKALTGETIKTEAPLPLQFSQVFSLVL